jgi:hypothetical protein
MAWPLHRCLGERIALRRSAVMSSKPSKPSKQIVLVWPSGDVVCEGFSVLAEEPAAEADQECPATMRSEDASGIFRAVSPAAEDAADAEASGPPSRAA